MNLWKRALAEVRAWQGAILVLDFSTLPALVVFVAKTSIAVAGASPTFWATTSYPLTTPSWRAHSGSASKKNVHDFATVLLWVPLGDLVMNVVVCSVNWIFPEDMPFPRSHSSSAPPPHQLWCLLPLIWQYIRVARQCRLGKTAEMLTSNLLFSCCEPVRALVMRA